MKIAFITGITGQDGSYLAELLLEKDMRFMQLLEEVLYTQQLELIIYLKIKISTHITAI